MMVMVDYICFESDALRPAETPRSTPKHQQTLPLHQSETSTANPSSLLLET
jgi:hypothetical protein